MRIRVGRLGPIAFCGAWGWYGYLGAQEPAPTYFSEAVAPWWQPQGTLLLEVERIPSVPEPEDPPTTRTRSLLQVGWQFPGRMAEGELAFRSALGSDGNAFNLPRYDQRPSNGAWLQRAALRFQMNREGGFGTVVLGLQGNPLISQESLWDHDLALTGVGLTAAWRRDEADLQEAGLRAVVGRARTFPAGKADLAAVQGVFRFGLAGLDWTAHLDHWELRWDRGIHRFAPLPDQADSRRQSQQMDVVGLGVQSVGAWPWEVRGIQQRNPVTGETGGELQFWLGARTRTWHPQLGIILQRFAPTGTFAPVNGDEWWFTHGARGPRYLLVVPAGKRWLLSFSYLDQKLDGGYYPARRTNLSVTWRF